MITMASRRFTLFLALILITHFARSQAPGDLAANLTLWLKADLGVQEADASTPEDQETVTLWVDQSATGIDFASEVFAATEIGPTYNVTNPDFNGNPSISFVDNYLAVDNYSAFPSASDLTFFTVVRATDGDGNRSLIGYGADEFKMRDFDDLDFEMDNSGGTIDFNVDILYSSSVVSYLWDNGGTDQAFLFLNGAPDNQNPIAENEPNLANNLDFVIGQDGDNDGTFEGGESFLGQTSEIILYGSLLTATQRRNVETYLAVKYGITLDITTTGANQAYTVGGTPIYGIDNIFSNDIAGLGTDVSQGLDQTASQSVNATSVVSIGSASDQADGEYLIWGHNGGDNTALTGDFDGGTNNGSARIWKVTETGDLGTVTLSIVDADLPSGVTRIIVDNNADLSSPEQDITLSGGSPFTVNVDFANNTTSYFSFIGSQEIAITGNSVDITDGETNFGLNDDRDFGTVDVALGTVENTFTITNSGGFDLVISSVNVTGTHSGDFTVTTSPVGTVASGGRTTLAVTFDPGASGLRSATVTVNSDDADEAAFDFAVQGTGGTISEISVVGNSVEIEDGDVTPSFLDDTDFGNTTSAANTFTINNNGSLTLTLGATAVSVSNTTDFSVTSQPATTVGGGGNTTFEITFTPSGFGVFSTNVTVANDDTDENPYNFIVQGRNLESGTTSNCVASITDLTVTNTQTLVANAYYPGSSDAVAGSTSIVIGTKRTIPVAFTDNGGTISAGDLLMIIQMQGAEIDANIPDMLSVGTSGNGEPETFFSTDYGDGPGGLDHAGFLNNSNFIAGQYEFVVASNAIGAGGGTLTITEALTNSYITNTTPTSSMGRRAFQVIKVGNYNNLTIDAGGEITTVPWNGTTGGIISIDALGSLTINGTIDANFGGFRGGFMDYSLVINHSDQGMGLRGEGIAGAPTELFGYEDDFVLTTDVTQADGYPGPDIASSIVVNADTEYGPFQGGGFYFVLNVPWSYNNERGGGAPANAGGSGVGNSGGGGGSNGGIGGVGAAYGFGSNATEVITAAGGAQLSIEEGSRLFLGGGGGSGGTINLDNTGFPSSVASGRPGGGGIIIRTETLTGTGNITTNGDGGASFTSVGINQADQIGSGGGGGSGGTIMLVTSTEDISGINFSATGGDGASLDGQQQFGSANGGGGGGSGGNIILIRRGSTFSPTPVNIDVDGGVAGETQQTPTPGVLANGGAGAVTLLTTPPSSSLDCPLIASAPVNPGGVTDAILWLRADQDVTFNGSNQVSSWNDFSSSSYTLTNTSVTGITGTTPDYIDGSFTAAEASSNPAFNFNPSLSFSGVADYLGFESFSNISTDAITAFVVTNFPTASANDQTILSYLPNDSQDDELDLGITDDSGGDGVRERVLDNSADRAGDLRDDVTRLVASDYDNIDANIWVNNGTAANTVLSVGTLDANGTFVLGQDLDDFGTPAFDGARDLEGQVADAIYFSRVLTDTERQRVSSYLSIKYGTTMDQTTDQDYLNSIGEAIYPVSSESANYAAYDNDIAGIGRDDGSGLSQLRSKSVNSDAILSGSHTDGFSIDRQFVIWGNNNSILTFNTTEISTGITNRIQREWRVAVVNSPDPVDLTFDLSSSTAATTITNTPVASANLALVIDDDGDFSNGFLRAISYSTWDGSTAVFNDVTINDDEVITLATVPDAPGGVSGLVLWLKSDLGVTSGGDGTEVTLWADQSGAGSDFASGVFTAETGPIFNASDANFNSNPSFSFTDNYLAVDNYAQFPSGSDLTYISVQRADASATAGTGSLIGYGADEFRIREMDALTIEIDNTAMDFGADADIRSATTVLSFQFTEGNGGTDSGSLFIDRTGDGQNPITVTEPDLANNLDFIIGQDSDNDGTIEAGDEYIGELGEILMYGSLLSDADLEKVESYVAIKYGITLDGDETDYIASDGEFIYETVNIPANYNNDIAGIGRDDISTLDQRSSISNNTDAIVTMALTDNGGTFGSPNAFTNNLSFIAWGNDNDDNGTIAEIASELPANVSTRLDREWRVQEKGTVGQVTMTIDLTGITVTGTVASDFLLLIDNGGDFSNGINRSIEATSFASNVVTFDVDFVDGEIFTLGTSRPSYSPGNISTSLRLWLRGDRGVTLTGPDVTGWADQSGNAFDATNAFGMAAVSSGALNNNDALDFDGGDIYTIATMTDDPSTANLSLYTVTQPDFVQTYGLVSQVAGSFGLIGHVNDGTMGSAVGGTASFTTTAVGIRSPLITGYTLTGSNLQWYLNGTADDLDNVGTVTTGTGIWAVGSANDGMLRFDGRLGEVVAYRQALSTADRNQVETYLAIKYGTTLNSGGSDYTSAEGNIIYPAFSDVNFSGFITNIAGVGRDDLSDLQQLVSGSTSSNILTVTKNVSFDTDGQYFVWGSNGTALGAATTADVPSGIEIRVERTWKVKTTNSPTGTIDLAFDLAAISGDIQTPGDLRVIVDTDDGNFSNSTRLSTVPTANGTVYTFAGIDLSNFPDEGFFTLGSIDITNTPLPVELASLSATAIDKAVFVQWKTAQEINNETFEVERSTDLETWEVLTQLPGAGNSSVPINYEFIDTYPALGINYYRLVQLDFDGEFTISNTVSAVIEFAFGEVDIFPNPTANQLSLRSTNNLKEAIFRVISVIGDEIYVPYTLRGENLVEMDVSKLRNGIYVIEIYINRSTYRRRVIIDK